MKTFIKNIIIALILAMLTWNGIIGLFLYNQSSEIDTEFGSVKKPNSKFVSGKEGYSYFITDKYGYNNDNFEFDKQDQQRLLILGDSMTEAAHLDRKLNYSSKLEEKLNTDNEKKFGVINFGRAGRSVADYIYYGGNYLKFEPDYVILSLESSDLFSDAINNGKKIYISKDGDYKIIENEFEDNFFQKFKYIKDKSGWFSPVVAYTAFQAQSALGSIKKNKAPKTVEAKTKTEITIDYKLINWEIKKLKEMYGDKLLILYISRYPQISQGKVIDSPNQHDQMHTEALFETCEKNNVPIIDTRNELNKFFIDKEISPFGFNNSLPGTGHYNKYGHEVVSQVLFEYIKNNIYPRTKN